MICPESHQTIIQQRQFLTMLHKGIDNGSHGTVSAVWVHIRWASKLLFLLFSQRSVLCLSFGRNGCRDCHKKL